MNGGCVASIIFLLINYLIYAKVPDQINANTFQFIRFAPCSGFNRSDICDCTKTETQPTRCKCNCVKAKRGINCVILKIIVRDAMMITMMISNKVCVCVATSNVAKIEHTPRLGTSMVSKKKFKNIQMALSWHFLQVQMGFQAPFLALSGTKNVIQ